MDNLNYNIETDEFNPYWMAEQFFNQVEQPADQQGIDNTANQSLETAPEIAPSVDPSNQAKAKKGKKRKTPAKAQPSAKLKAFVQHSAEEKEEVTISQDKKIKFQQGDFTITIEKQPKPQGKREDISICIINIPQ